MQPGQEGVGEGRERGEGQRQEANLRMENGRDATGGFPDESHQDTAELYGLKLPRQVVRSQWSEEKETAGMNLDDGSSIWMMDYPSGW